MEGKFWYVYMLRSLAVPERYYVGVTEDIRVRVRCHNAGHVSHTAKFRPWQVETAVAFRSRDKAFAFERYLKTHSGRAFAKKHF
jgi:putative endonuclease